MQPSEKVEEVPEDSVINMIQNEPMETVPHESYPSQESNYYPKQRQTKGGYRGNNRGSNRGRPHYGDLNDMNRRRGNRPGEHYRNNGRYNQNGSGRDYFMKSYTKGEGMDDMHRMNNGHGRKSGSQHVY